LPIVFSTDLDCRVSLAMAATAISALSERDNAGEDETDEVGLAARAGLGVDPFRIEARRFERQDYTFSEIEV